MSVSVLWLKKNGEGKESKQTPHGNSLAKGAHALDIGERRP